MVMLVQLQPSHFLYKIRSNALPLEEVVMNICKQKNFFFIKVSLPWVWYGTFNEILYYKSFTLPPFSTTNQTGRKSSSSSYPVYPAHRKLWSRSREERTTITHTHKRECCQRVPRLEKGSKNKKQWRLILFIILKFLGVFFMYVRTQKKNRWPCLLYIYLIGFSK